MRALKSIRNAFYRPPFDPDAIAERNLRHAEEQRELYREQGRQEAQAKGATWYAGYDIGYTDGYQEGRRNAYSALGHDLPQEPVKEPSEGWTSAPDKSSFINPLYAKES